MLSAIGDIPVFPEDPEHRELEGTDDADAEAEAEAHEQGEALHL